jgi:hypothetical protein
MRRINTTKWPERETRLAAVRLSKGNRLRVPDGSATAHIIRNRGLTRGLAAYFLDHDARSYELISRVFQGQAEGPHARRHPRQHHDHLVDEHGAFWRPSLLGDFWQTRVFQCQRRLHPGYRKRLPRRTLSSPAELGGAGVSQTDPLQQARQRRSLRGMGTAETVLRRGSRGLQNAAQLAERVSDSVLRRGWPTTSSTAWSPPRRGPGSRRSEEHDTSEKSDRYRAHSERNLPTCHDRSPRGLTSRASRGSRHRRPSPRPHAAAPPPPRASTRSDRVRRPRSQRRLAPDSPRPSAFPLRDRSDGGRP